MKRYIGAALLCAAIPSAALAQVVAASAPTAPIVTAAPAPVTPPAVPVIRLPGNTSVTFSLNGPLNSKSNLTGEKFSMTVAQDVIAQGHVVIPRGTHAVGQINYSKGNGSFGKSGKMDLVFRYIDINGIQIPVEGHYFQEGRGNGAATVGAVLGAGVIGGLVVKGHNAELTEGREFSATIPSDVLFASNDGGRSYTLDQSYSPAHVNMSVETEQERKARFKAAKN